MESYIELIQDLTQQVEQVTYKNGQLDSVKRRADMLLRRIFGDKSHYLKDLKKIRYTPMYVTSTTGNGVYIEALESGKKKLLNLLNVIKEDLQLEPIKKAVDKQPGISQAFTPNIFIVHGHNEEMKSTVARTIERLKLNSIILHEQPSKGRTVIEKFTGTPEVSFAVVLLSADDIGYKRTDNSENARFRARQNVIFELGYFFGKLGRERVLVLHEIAKDFEIPSDYSGVLFVPYDSNGRWQFELVKELKALDIPVDANDIL